MKKILAAFILLALFAGCSKTGSVGPAVDNTPKKGWSHLGGDFPQISVLAELLVIDSKGDIYSTALDGSKSTHEHILKYDGTTWTNIGNLGVGGLSLETLLSFAIDSADNIYVGGKFHAIPGDATDGNNVVAKYNGTTWSRMGDDKQDGNVSTDFIGSLATNGSAIIYSQFKSPKDGVRRIVKWDGVKWVAIANPPNKSGTPSAYGLHVDKTGNLYAFGTMLDTDGHLYIAKWNGSTWSNIGFPVITNDPANAVTATFLDKKGNLYVAGNFKNANGHHSVVKWNGLSWTELGSLNANDFVSALAQTSDGHLYAAGRFTNAAGYNYVAEWDGAKWSELGVGDKIVPLNANLWLTSLAVDAKDNIYVAGDFSDPKTHKTYIAKYTR